MMVLPFGRPSLGLGFGGKTLSLVEIRRGWGPRGEVRVRRCSERPLPDGLIRLSAAEPNVTDVPALARELRALRGSERPASAALALPDLSTRVALFDFEALPPKTADRDKLVRWRFQKDFNMPAADLRLSYQVFPATPPRVLAVGARTGIVGQYERACEQAGLLPITVGVTSPRLFELCRPAMQATLASGAHGGGELFFLHVADGSFSLLAFRDGSPAFLRTKLLHNGGSSEPAALPGEVLATLQFYADSYSRAQAGPPDAIRPFFVVGLPPTYEVLDPERAASMRIKVIPIGWDHIPVSRNGRRQAVPDARPLSGLPALAGLLEA